MYRVWYGTHRVPKIAGEQVTYTAQRDEVVHHGHCDVFVPKWHTFGSVGENTWRARWSRFYTGKDDLLRLERTVKLEEPSFWEQVQTLLAAAADDERAAVVYLHGYNVTFEAAAIRAAQIGFDLKVRGVMAFYSWPSRGKTKLYPPDEATIEGSEAFIMRFLVDMVQRSGATKVHLIAHSMGNRGLLRAVQQIAANAALRSGVRFGQILLAAPDVDAQLFRSFAGLYPSLSERTTLYVSAKDMALELSDFLHDYDRAGYMPPVTIVPGIDTIEVTDIDLTTLGHGYFAEAAPVLNDMHELLRYNAPPAKRARTESVQSEGREYWRLKG